MFIEETIKVNKEDGLISVELKGRNATAGNFSLAVDSENGFQIIGRGKFGDNLPDVFIIPFKSPDIENHGLGIVGNFSAGNPIDDDTVSFDINFYQKGELLQTIKFRKKKNGVIALNYSIIFEIK